MMRTLARLIFFVGLLIGSLAAPVFAQDNAHAGDDFLKLLDTKKYAESWDVASDLLKQSVSRSEWTTRMVKTRDTLGEVASRKLKSAQADKDPKNSPPGDYLLLTYETVFASQGAPHTETLPLIKGPDGRWHAVDYFVR
jgi:hypothetical protein